MHVSQPGLLSVMILWVPPFFGESLGFENLKC